MALLGERLPYIWALTGSEQARIPDLVKLIFGYDLRGLPLRDDLEEWRRDTGIEVEAELPSHRPPILRFASEIDAIQFKLRWL